MDSKVEEKIGMKEDVDMDLGKSLKVPSVQEIMKNDFESVPERYIQDHENKPNYELNVNFESSDIPIIDLSKLINGDQDELNKLDFACKEWGFFQIINHGVAEEILHDIKGEVAAFFDLPLEEKKKYSMPENDVHGYGQAFVVSEEQKLDWCDLIFLRTQPLEDRRMKYWPTTLPGFIEAVEKHSTEVTRVANEIMENLSLLMGMDKNGLEKLHVVTKQAMRMNYYPPCPRPEFVMGVSPHSDGGSITLLLQDDEITGLQIKHKGQWVPVKPIPSALVVNVGDSIECWSNGMYKSIEHRGVIDAKKARMSIATFVMPHEGVELGPVESMIKDRPRMYKNIKFMDYIKHQLDRKLDGKSHTDFLKLES